MEVLGIAYFNIQGRFNKVTYSNICSAGITVELTSRRDISANKRATLHIPFSFTNKELKEEFVRELFLDKAKYVVCSEFNTYFFWDKKDASEFIDSAEKLNSYHSNILNLDKVLTSIYDNKENKMLNFNKTENDI